MSYAGWDLPTSVTKTLCHAGNSVTGGWSSGRVLFVVTVSNAIASQGSTYSRDEAAWSHNAAQAESIKYKRPNNVMCLRV